MRKGLVVAALLLCCGVTLLAAEGGTGSVQPQNTVYVSPNVIQSRVLDIFTTFALTNTTPYWFNPRIYLIDQDGEIVRHFSPLLKGFGTWQKTSLDILPGDFQGSVWIVSPQPIIATSFIHQAKEDGSLILLGNNELHEMEPTVAEAMLQRVQ